MKELFKHHLQSTHMPYVPIKAAITFDGKIATQTGASQWISCPESLAYVHELRDLYSSIGVGVNTIIMDNPSLTIRLPHQKITCHPCIIFDSIGRIPLESKVLNDEFKTLTHIMSTPRMPKAIKEAIESKGAHVHMVNQREGHVDLHSALLECGKLGIDSLFIEGGSELIASLLSLKLVQEVSVALAPKLFGGSAAKGFMGEIGVKDVDDAIQLHFIEKGYSFFISFIRHNSNMFFKHYNIPTLPFINIIDING